MDADRGEFIEDEMGERFEKDDYRFRVQQTEALVDQIRARLGLLNKKTDDVVLEQLAVVKEADAALREAKVILDTTERLAKDGVVSRIEYEIADVRAQGVEARYLAAISEVMQLRSQLSERRAQLALARQQLEDATIRAPFSGAIMRRQGSIGEFLRVNAAVVTLFVKIHCGCGWECRNARPRACESLVLRHTLSSSPNRHDPAQPALRSTSSTASGCFAISASSTRVGASGRDLPCSQLRSVAGGSPNFVANSDWLRPICLRTWRTSTSGT